MFHASVATGLEPAAVEELRRLGLAAVETRRGLVRFEGTAEHGARAALGLRCAPRVALELETGIPAHPAGLFDRVERIPWEEHLPDDAAFAVRAVGTSASLRHTRFTAQLTKDAIRSRFRARGRECPPVDPGRPAVLIEIRIERELATAGLDLGGASLHQRRGAGPSGEAPLREDVAAALAILAGASGDEPIVDPFCGSGALICEAASAALGRPAGRAPGGMSLARLPAFRDLPLDRIARELRANKRTTHPPFLAFDRDPGAVSRARGVIERMALTADIAVSVATVPDLPLPDLPPGLLISNPPWGLRLSKSDAESAWGALGRLAHGRLRGWRLGLLSGDPDVTRLLGMKAERRWPVTVGGADARFLIYRVR